MFHTFPGLAGNARRILSLTDGQARTMPNSTPTLAKRANTALSQRGLFDTFHNVSILPVQLTCITLTYLVVATFMAATQTQINTTACSQPPQQNNTNIHSLQRHGYFLSLTVPSLSRLYLCACPGRTQHARSSHLLSWAGERETVVVTRATRV